MSSMGEPVLFGIENVREIKDGIDWWCSSMVEYKAVITKRVAEALGVRSESLIVGSEAYFNPTTGPLLEKVAHWIHVICRQHIGQIHGNPFSGEFAKPIDTRQIPYQARVATNDPGAPVAEDSIFVQEAMAA